jgi:hypothetical protein
MLKTIVSGFCLAVMFSFLWLCCSWVFFLMVGVTVLLMMILNLGFSRRIFMLVLPFCCLIVSSLFCCCISVVLNVSSSNPCILQECVIRLSFLAYSFLHYEHSYLVMVSLCVFLCLCFCHLLYVAWPHISHRWWIGRTSIKLSWLSILKLEWISVTL